MNCAFCGHANSDNTSRFCGYCGRPLGTAPPPPANMQQFMTSQGYIPAMRLDEAERAEPEESRDLRPFRKRRFVGLLVALILLLGLCIGMTGFTYLQSLSQTTSVQNILP